MKQKFTFLIAALMLLTMIFQPVMVRGQAKTTETYTFNSKNWTATNSSSATANWTNYTAGDSFESADPARGIAKSKASINGTSPVVLSNVSSITVVASANQAGPTLTIYKVVNNVETSIYSASMTKANNKSYTVNLTGANVFSGKIKVVLASSSSYKSVWIKSVSVTYTPTHTLTYSATSGSIAGTLYGTSTVVNTGDAVAEGGQVSLEATPSAGYSFSSWDVSGTGSTLSNTSANPTIFTMGTANATVTANFVSTGDYINVSPTSVDIDCNGDVAEFDLTTSISTPSYSIAYYTTSSGDETTDKPGWLGDVEFSGNTLYIEVNENTGAARSAYFKVYAGTTYSSVITINQAVYKSAAPTIPATANFDYTKTITITPATGTTVYYTLDGTDPTNASTEYTEPFEINATKTLKAIAYDANNYSSDVVSATYTRVYDYISDIDEAAYYTVKGTVVAVNGTNAFVLGDGTGYIYCYMSHSKSVGDLVAITNGHVKNYNHVWEFENGTLSVAASTTYTPGTPAITAWTEEIFNSYSGSGVANLGTYFEVVGTYATTNKEITIAGTDKKVRLSSSNTYSSLNGKTVKAKGYFAGMNTSGTTPSAMYICPESVAECPIVTTSVASIADFTYNVGSGPSVKTFTVSGTNLTDDITVSTNSANFEISSNGTDYQITEITISKGEGTTISATTIHVRLKAGLSSDTYNGKITVSSDGADDKEIALTGTVKHLIDYGESITGCASIGSTPSDAAVTGTSVSLTATAASGYKFSEWDVYKTGETSTKVTVTDNAFEMPAYNVTVSAIFEVAYSVTYEGNGSTGGSVPTDSNSPYNSGATVTVLGNTGDLVKTGHSFTGWNTKDDGTGIGYTAGATFTISAPTTLYAQWGVESYNVTMSTNDNATLAGTYGLSGTLAEGETKSIEYGAEVTLSATGVAAGKVFFWTVTRNLDSSDVTDDVLDGTTLTVPDYAITISGTVAELFITYSGDLTEGDYIIARNKKAMNNTVSNSKLGTTDITDYENDGEVVVANASAYTWHVAKVTISDTDYWTIMNGSNYAASTGTKSQAQLTTTNDDKCKWTISGTGGSSGYTIVNKHNSEHSVNAYLRYDNSYYACYASSNNESVFYKKVTGSQHSVTIDGGIENGSVEASLTNAYEGQSVTLTPTPASGYVFDAWDVYKTGDASTKVTVSNNSFTMPSYDVTVSATFTAPAKYQLVTSGSQLVAGKHYVIASGTSGTAYAMGYQNTNNRPKADVKFDGDGNIIENSYIWEFVLSGWAYDVAEENSGWTFYDKFTEGEGFLYAAGSGSNYLKLQSTLDNNGRWSISIDETDHYATIVAQGTNTNNIMRYNTSGMFSCYTGGQSPIYLYVKVDDSDYEIYSPTTVANLTIASTDTYTVESGQILTVSGTLTNKGTAANLIIEDGGQLIVHNTGVQATIKKTVTASAKNSTNWYTIASPVRNVNIGAVGDAGSVNNLKAAGGEYDLYRFNETKDDLNGNLRWENYKNSAYHDGGADDFTSLETGRGYLYRREGTATLEYVGEVNGNASETYTLTVAGDAPLTGFHLIGNPYSHDIYKGTGAAIDDSKLNTGFYRLTNGTAWTPALGYGDPIHSGEGILVQANAGGTLTISNSTTSASGESKYNNDNIMFSVANSQNEDVTYAVFDKGHGLNKIEHRDDNIPMLYISQNGEDYAIAMMSDDTKTFGLSLKVKTIGQYTLSYKTKGEFNYIHVIDRLTGEDVDMLLEGEYNFVASPNDIRERFIVKLAYLPDYSDGANDVFAFQNGSEILVSGDGELQIFDVMGRLVMTTTINGVESVNVPAQGVYIFRLVGNEIKNQKIVVR